MKKILLQKERDEVNAAASSANHLLPSVFRPEIPFSRLNDSCLEENKNLKLLSDKCNQSETPSRETPSRETPSRETPSRTGALSIERSRAGMPAQIGERDRVEIPLRSDILKVSSLVSGASVAMPAVPVLMMASSAGGVGVGLGHDRYFLGNTGSAVFGLPSYSFPGYYQIGSNRLQNVSPTRVLQPGRMKDEVYLDESVGHAATSLGIPVKSLHEQSNLPLRAKAELQGYTNQYVFDQRSFSLARSRGSVLEDKRPDADLDSVSSSDILEKTVSSSDILEKTVSSSNTVEKPRSDSMKSVEVDSDDEGVSIRKWRSNALDDIRNDDLPKMIDKERLCMRASPLNMTDSYNYSRKENVRCDSVDTFKSPAVENQKTMCRPKGRPAKITVSGEVGSGGRSIIRCPVCGKLFNNSSALAKHKLTHSDERKYVCTLCSKAFKRQDHLNGHMMTHSSTKPFGCKFIGCNKSYCDARSLRRHMENHHQEFSTAAAASGPSGYFNFDSSTAPQSFGADVGQEKLGSYLQQVSPISPVLREGPQLSRPFASFSSNHAQNTMWVTGYNPLDEPRPIKCGVCGRGFKNIPALNGHMRLHGGYVRKDQDLDESQDVSRGSEPRSESRFSLQSESSQSSTSASDRQHDSIKSNGSLIFSSSFSAKANLNDPEFDKRDFLMRPSSSERDHLYDRSLSVSNSHPTSNVFNEDLKYFPRARAIYSAAAAESNNRNESGMSNDFEMNRVVRHHGVFGDCNDEPRPLCPSPRNTNKHDDGIARILGQRLRSAEEERNYAKTTDPTLVNCVQNIPADCSQSTMKDTQNKMKREIQREKPINNLSCIDLQQQQQQSKPWMKLRKSTDANDLPGAVIPSQSSAVTDRHLVEGTGTGCLIDSRLANQVKGSISSGRKIDGYSISQQKVVPTGEERFQASVDDEHLPDSTSGKQEIDVCRLEKMETYTGGHSKLGITAYESGLPRAKIVQDVETASAVEVSAACNMYNLSPNEDFAHGIPSAEIDEGRCLYRKRWMNLQLKQAVVLFRNDPPPGTMSSTSSTVNQCSDTRAKDATNTDCGEPFSPKGSSRFGEIVSFQSGTCKSHAGENAEASGNVNSNCLPGSHETGFVSARSGPSTPVQHADQGSSLLSKRFSSGLFSHPNVVLHREVTAAVIHGCHNSSASGRDGLHHVHSNSCITQVGGIQSSIPSSPYDLHPHTPCAAHTPYTPCQTYTPHTPFTPVNHPGTPKHASHFEFPPRDCLQESSMCDSPFAAHGSQLQRSNQPLEVCLVVEPENGHYLSQQRPKKMDKETELKSLRQLCQQDESLYRKVMETDNMNKEHLLLNTLIDGSNRSHVLAQMNLEIHRLYSGNQAQARNVCHSLVQNEARNPDDGMSASLPTGAKRDSHLEASVADERDSTDDRKHEKQMERKRKPSHELESESDHKRPAVWSGASGEEMLASVDVQTKQENLEANEEVDGNLQKSSSDHKSGIVFRNPPSPLKVKKPKPRPEPLFIPANVNHIGFQSRLRSPRLWDGLIKQTPPYTPPPMLSPARSGPGLFWTLHSGYHSPLPPAPPPVLPKYGKSKTGKSWNESAAPPSVIEFENEPPPGTDVQPHINIGLKYQPDLPHLHGCEPVLRDNSDCDDHSSLVWNPSSMDKLRDDEVTQFMDYACCAAIPGNGVNKEYALHLLHACKGDMKKAGRLLLEPELKLPKSSCLTTYKYQECVKWKKPEIEKFHRAIMKVDKDFFQIAKLVTTKTVKDCVQFYYLWKKICPDESKQLKLLRRKREQLELYSRRSKDLHDQSPPPLPPPPPPIKPCLQLTQNSSDKTNASSDLKKDDSTDLHYRTSSGACNSLKEEKMEDYEKRWCSICKRSFTSARNFSVHMKKHQQSSSAMEAVELSQTVKTVKLPYSALNSVF